MIPRCRFHAISGCRAGGFAEATGEASAARGVAALRGEYPSLLQPGVAGREAMAVQRASSGARGVRSQSTASVAGEGLDCCCAGVLLRAWFVPSARSAGSSMLGLCFCFDIPREFLVPLLNPLNAGVRLPLFKNYTQNQTQRLRGLMEEDGDRDDEGGVEDWLDVFRC